MSIVKKHLILHTFENIRAVHDLDITCGGREHKSWVINRLYPATVLPNDVYRYAKTYKMLVENTCRKGIVYIEWLVKKTEVPKRFILFR